MVKVYDNIYCLPSEYLQAIGQIALSWSYLEIIIQRIMWHFIGLAGNSLTGIAITRHLNFPMTYNMFRSLLELWLYQTNNKEQFDTLQNLIADADGLCKQRNEVIHTCWYHENNKLVCTNFSARGSLQSKDLSYNLGKLKKLISNINDCYIDFSKIFEEIESLPPSYHNKLSQLSQTSSQSQDQNKKEPEPPPESSEE